MNQSITKNHVPICKALRTIRKRAGLTQKELAALAGVRQATIAEIESGKNCTITTLTKIVEAIGGSIQIKYNKKYIC